MDPIARYPPTVRLHTKHLVLITTVLVLERTRSSSSNSSSTGSIIMLRSSYTQYNNLLVLLCSDPIDTYFEVYHRSTPQNGPFRLWPALYSSCIHVLVPIASTQFPLSKSQRATASRPSIAHSSPIKLACLPLCHVCVLQQYSRTRSGFSAGGRATR